MKTEPALSNRRSNTANQRAETALNHDSWRLHCEEIYGSHARIRDVREYLQRGGLSLNRELLRNVYDRTAGWQGRLRGGRFNSRCNTDARACHRAVDTATRIDWHSEVQIER
jgi:hypothetical protein